MVLFCHNRSYRSREIEAFVLWKLGTWWRHRWFATRNDTKNREYWHDDVHFNFDMATLLVPALLYPDFDTSSFFVRQDVAHCDNLTKNNLFLHWKVINCKFRCRGKERLAPRMLVISLRAWFYFFLIVIKFQYNDSFTRRYLLSFDLNMLWTNDEVNNHSTKN